MSNNKKNSESKTPEKTCFVMMPISDMEGYEIGHFTNVYNQIIAPAARNAGYKPFRADEDYRSRMITTTIIESALEYDMAICDLSGLNPNVVYELGMRQAFDKPVVLIKDDDTPMFFDIAPINTITYKKLLLYSAVLKAQEEITLALQNTTAENSSILKYMKAEKAELPKESEELTKEYFLFESIDRRLEKLESSQPYISDSNRNRKKLNDFFSKTSVVEIKRKRMFTPKEVSIILSSYYERDLKYDFYFQGEIIVLCFPTILTKDALFEEVVDELGTLVSITDK